MKINKYVIFIMAGVLGDQLLKYWSVMHFEPGQQLTLIPYFLGLARLNNYGAAYNILSGKTWFFYIITAIAVLIFGYLLFKGKEKKPLFLSSITLLLTGTLGNGIDRICHGYVIDMIAVNILNLPLLNFVCNLADIFITIGVLLLFIYLTQDGSKKSR